MIEERNFTEHTAPRTRLSRRDLLKAIGVGAAGGLLAACVPVVPGAKPAATGPEAAGGEVYFFLHAGGDELAAYQEWGQRFVEENPQYTFRADFVPFDEYLTKLRTMFAANNVPDFFWLYFNYAEGFVADDVLVALGDFVAKDSFAIQDFAPANVDMFTVNGNLYGIPRESSTLALYWSKKAFADAGIEPPNDSWTWEGEFLTAAKALTVESDDPTQRRFGVNPPVGVGMNWAAMPVVWSFGGDIVNEDKSAPTVNAAETVQGYQFLADLINVHRVAPQLGALAGQPTGQLFLNGQIGMYMSGLWEVAGLEQTRKEMGLDGYDVAVLPAGPAGRMTRTSGGAYAIPKHAKNPVGAWDAIKFFADLDFTTYMVENQGLFPAYLPALKSEAFLPANPTPESKKIFAESLTFARPERVFENYGELTTLVEAAMDTVYAGEETAQAALDEVQRKAVALF